MTSRATKHIAITVVKIGMPLFLIAALLLTGTVLANGTLALDRYIFGGGGGHSAAGDYALDAVFGQAVVGATSSGPYELGPGYFSGTGTYRVYMPTVLSNRT